MYELYLLESQGDIIYFLNCFPYSKNFPIIFSSHKVEKDLRLFYSLGEARVSPLRFRVEINLPTDEAHSPVCTK